jgi:hypothetical protein
MPIALEFWLAGLGLVLAGIGIYLSLKADALLQTILKQVEALKRMLCS